MKKRVLSGIRATGRLHLGNYLGAVKGMLALQNDPSYETLYMVADLHSINTQYDTKSFQESVRGVLLDYLSAGLDPEKSIIFVQSHVPEHVELSYLFSTTLTVARMLHLPTYKDKLKENSENANMAMLYYPVLMASDILIYKANAVPVGDDQLPHLEVAREVARKMNEKYGTDFPEPEQFKTEGHYVPSLTGEGKMSKSVGGSYISLASTLSEIRAGTAKIPTDSGRGDKIPQIGGVTSLLEMVELFEGKEKRKEYEHQYLGQSGLVYSEVKNELAESIYKDIEPIQAKRKELENNPEYVEKVIKEGSEMARKIASETLREVKQKMGLV
ncbi:MAG: Tryptophanyl-tRNA synthetase [Candidatus Woesebacteria bacterium GW2011_GWA1_39_21b]|uniref:Tryptophan--tRNA ligase n=3 Tax=Candidatus Woeseibacteriota TaxID=1752722 RepID=A0A0G0NDB7_9BACT|nr:MAG: Tryptophanyl-tRNA synthetase [Microgenomates group bacterium GW2011_GWC1_38_12]KKR10806.1 MAG: Tryptophanyl-tRNA synthetase [Candidatus Woesebacteria bacterium GW2011_GWA1_39_21b]